MASWNLAGRRGRVKSGVFCILLLAAATEGGATGVETENRCLLSRAQEVTTVAVNRLTEPKGDTYAKIYWYGRTFKKLHICGSRGVRQEAQVGCGGNGAETDDRVCEVGSGPKAYLPRGGDTERVGLRSDETACRNGDCNAQDRKRGADPEKDDLRDAFQLANALRMGLVKPVYKESKSYGRLRSLVDIYEKTSMDTVRVQNRVKALFRSRGVDTSGKTIYTVKHRAAWLSKLTDKYVSAAEVLFEQYDMMCVSKRRAKKLMVEELHQYPISSVLESCPGFG